LAFYFKYLPKYGGKIKIVLSVKTRYHDELILEKPRPNISSYCPFSQEISRERQHIAFIELQQKPCPSESLIIGQRIEGGHALRHGLYIILE
jgi:hypothetical protein